MVFKPIPCKTRWEGLFATSWVVLVDVLLAVWILRRPVDWISFLLLILWFASLPLLLHLAYRTWGAFNLEYWINRDALTVRWAATRHVIPLAAIRRVIQGSRGELGGPGLLDWPGPHVRASHPGGKFQLERYASRPLADCLLLDTDQALFALSPAQPERFLSALQDYHRLGPAHTLSIQREQPGFCEGEIALNRTGATLLVLGVIGTLVLFGTLMIRYPRLPDLMVFHYNSVGLPDSIRSKGALFLLPLIGASAFLVNGVWGVWMACREQYTGAYLLWGGTVTVQLLSLLALVSLIR